MRSLPPPALSRLVAVVALGLAGCMTGEVPIGEDEQELVFTPPEPGATCEAFCEAASAKGCPPTGDCVALCEAERAHAPACSDELDEWLACAPRHLLPGVCSMTELGDGDPYEEASPCFGGLNAYGACVRAEAASRFQATGDACHRIGWGSYQTASGDEIHKAMAACDPAYGPAIEMTTRCGAGGGCECLVDDEVAHVCQNLLHTIYLTEPGHGCCGRYFDDVIAGLPL